jgi:hypothetical protein
MAQVIGCHPSAAVYIGGHASIGIVRQMILVDDISIGRKAIHFFALFSGLVNMGLRFIYYITPVTPGEETGKILYEPPILLYNE